MPNNSSARREKKSKEKKKSEKRRTAPPPLHKEDTASVDEAPMDSVAHPLSLSGQDECIMDTSSSSLSLAGIDDVNGLYVRGPAQKALLDEFRLSLTQEQTAEMYGKLRENHPDANAKELAGNLRTVMVTAALEARWKKIQDEKAKSPLG